MMTAKDSMPEHTIFTMDNNEELLSMARAFLISDGVEKVAMARAMLEIMNT